MFANLKIYSPVNSDAPTDVPISADIPISITIAIADVREPDKRNSAFSKTLTLPGSKILNILFEHIFDVTTELNNFNPNLKTRCEYFVRGEKVFEGDIQLLKIRTKGKSPMVEIFYECSIVGRLANIFLDLGNALLEDLDLSDLNHTFSYPVIATVWSSYTPGVGYYYPFIDYGCAGGNITTWYLQYLKPATFEIEYVDRIFLSIGKTYSSTFLGGAYHNQIVIPDSNEGGLKMTAAQINATSFYAGKTALTTYTLPLTNLLTSWYYNLPTPQTTIGQLVFNDDTNSPFYDGGNNYSTVTNTFITPANTEYKFAVSCDFEVLINPPAGTTSTTIVNGTYRFMIYIYNASLSVIVATSSVTTTATTAGYTAFSVTCQIPSAYSQANLYYYCDLATDDAGFLETIFWNGGTPITAGTASLTVRQKTTSWFSIASIGNLPIGYTVNMNNTIPKNVKQIDFLMGIIKSENLYMELDLTDSDNYIIEKRADFFQDANPLDWTSKWDFQKETEIIPMGDLDFREYLFTYKKDGDKYNKLYFDEFGETYGQEQIYVDNDFIQSQKKNELIFAATPLVGNSQNNLVYPVMAQSNGTAIKPMACIIRRLYVGGLLSCNMYSFESGTQNFQFTSYPYAGHLDNPYNPTIDLCWDNPKKLYYNFPALTYTNNNLYVRNWQKFIEQITDQNSKVVVMWMYLKASDISKFTFRKKVWIVDSYYLVNKIFDYNPQEVQSTKVEFLRLGFVEDPVVEIINIWENGLGETSGYQYGMIAEGGGINPFGNDSNPQGLAMGENNNNQGVESNIVGGEFNFIGGDQDGNV